MHWLSTSGALASSSQTSHSSQLPSHNGLVEFVELHIVESLGTDTSAAFDQVEDVEGSLSCLEKKATIFRHRQEDSLAAEVDMMYDAVANAALLRDNEARGVNSAES